MRSEWLKRRRRSATAAAVGFITPQAAVCSTGSAHTPLAHTELMSQHVPTAVPGRRRLLSANESALPLALSAVEIPSAGPGRILQGAFLRCGCTNNPSVFRSTRNFAVSSIRIDCQAPDTGAQTLTAQMAMSTCLATSTLASEWSRVLK